MMISIVAALAMNGATPAPARIEIGHAQWGKLPALARVERDLPIGAMVDRVEGILASKQCKLEGQSARRFEISVPYAVMLSADGKAQRVLVADMGCAPLEEMVGETVYQMSELGDFKNGRAQSGRWYADRIELILQ